MPGEGSGLWPDAACKAGQRESPVVKSPGLHELSTRREQSFVERADLLNRPLRTRTVGGVGGWGARSPWLPPGSPIRPLRPPAGIGLHDQATAK